MNLFGQRSHSPSSAPAHTIPESAPIAVADELDPITALRARVAEYHAQRAATARAGGWLHLLQPLPFPAPAQVHPSSPLGRLQRQVRDFKATLPSAESPRVLELQNIVVELRELVDAAAKPDADLPTKFAALQAEPRLAVAFAGLVVLAHASDTAWREYVSLHARVVGEERLYELDREEGERARQAAQVSPWAHQWLSNTVAKIEARAGSIKLYQGSTEAADAVA